MKPEDLDLCSTEELIAALHRRMTSYVVLASRPNRTPDLPTETLIVMNGPMVEVCGLLRMADMKMRRNMAMQFEMEDYKKAMENQAGNEGEAE